MNSKLYITSPNESYIKITSNDSGVLREILSRYTFTVPGQEWNPKVRNGFWDGKIRLFNVKSGLLYKGLLQDLLEWAEKEEYDVETDFTLEKRDVSEEELRAFIQTLNIPKEFVERYYQLDGILECLNEQRKLILSPTGSGKSFLLYILYKWHQANNSNSNVLIVVPTVALVKQLNSDFTEYNNNIPIDTLCIQSGVDKSQIKKLTISTWQSIYNQPESWFDRFTELMMDEVHQGKAKEISKIPEKCRFCADKYGFTGTLDDSLTHEMVLRGLFGPIKRIASTKELQDKKWLAEIDLKILMLKYPKEMCKTVRREKDFRAENTMINTFEPRMKFIRNLCDALDGNTLVLFQFVNNHGIPMFDYLKHDTDIPTFIAHGGIDADVREELRVKINELKRSRTAASAGVFSTGINIKNLDNIILTAGGKAKIKLLQSIGRGLRISENSSKLRLFDISDDLRIGKYVNYSLKHLKERIKIYDNEEFDYSIVNYSLPMGESV